MDFFFSCSFFLFTLIKTFGETYPRVARHFYEQAGLNPFYHTPQVCCILPVGVRLHVTCTSHRNYSHHSNIICYVSESHLYGAGRPRQSARYTYLRSTRARRTETISNPHPHRVQPFETPSGDAARLPALDNWKHRGQGLHTLGSP